MTQKFTLLGSEYSPQIGTRSINPLETTHQISTTWILNRNQSEAELKALIQDITDYCKQYNLIVEQDDPYHLKVIGSSFNFKNALEVQMIKIGENDDIFHANTTPIKLKLSWQNKVDNILGLNNKKIAQPRSIKLDKTLAPRALVTFNPLQLATLYNFPTGLNGSGQKIGIIELGGGYVASDISYYYSQLGISATPNINVVSVDGATNSPDNSGASIEVVLNIEVIGALVPNAQMNVYFAPNSYQGFYNAINRAILDNCNIISISWGAPEVYWPSSTLNSYNSLFQTGSNNNITILAAAGNNGSSDGTSGLSVDFPSSSPYVVACGGTHLETINDVDISQEVVWNNNSTTSATGGGLSAHFSRPSYQTSVSYNLNNKRGVPDVCGNADPNSGYVLYSSSQGGFFVVGGTSAVSPLWSGLFGRVNQSIGHNVGFIHPTIYANPSVCHDITVGNNGAYFAGTGWDPCSGNGSPNGQLVLNLFSAPSSSAIPIISFTGTSTSGNIPLTVNFTASGTNSPTSWLWNFGDSTTSTSQNPSRIYSNVGNYNVSLKATNSVGSNTLTKNNYINTFNSGSAPVASFNASPLSGNRPLTVNFTATSTNSPTSWLWHFGDSTTSTSQNPSHTYSSTGNYTVTLTVTNSYGSNTLVQNNYINVTGSTPPPSPVANFTGTPLSGTTPLTVNFTDTSTNIPTSWLWNFGDSTTSTSKNPSRTYSTAGNYTVSLTATNSGGSNTNTKTNYVSVTNPLPPAPVANFTGTPLSGTAPLTVNFTDTSTNTPTSWLWNFGDSTTSTSKNPSHTYSTAGNYTVSLTATNSGGSNTNTKTNYINVTASTGSAPMASFNASRTYGTPGITVYFTDTSTNSPTSWLWNFGDGHTSTLQNPSHQFASTGTHYVILTASNSAGSSQASKYIYIFRWF